MWKSLAIRLCRLALLAAATWYPVAQAAEPVTIRLGDLAQSVNGIASGVMVSQGIDKKYGLKVEYSVYPTLDGLFTAIRGKQVDIGFGGWTAFAQFRSKGVPVTMLYPVGRGASLDVLVTKDSPIRSLADLKGKRIGSYAGAAGTATVLLRVLTSKYFGYDPGTGGQLQYAGPGLLPSLLEKGEISAALLFDPLAAKAIASGKFRSIGNLADVYKDKVGEDFLWTGYATNDDFMKARPEALANFVRAWIEAVNYVKTHPEVFVAYGKQFGFDADNVRILQERVNADYVLTWNDEYIRYLGNFARLSNEVMGAGFLDSVPPAAFTTRFVPK